MRKLKCIKCDEDLTNVQYWWDEGGYGYSAKMCKCPVCGTIQYLEIIEDKCLDVNNDKKFYQ